MLTLKQLKETKPDTIFARGETTDSPDGMNIGRTNKQLRWVAVRGDIHDWAIYCHLAENDWDYIKRFGNKIFSEENIKRFVPCDVEAFKMYRY